LDRATYERLSGHGVGYSSDMSKLGKTLTRLKGKAMRPLADAAGDRRSEAKATLEAQTGEKPNEPQLNEYEYETRLHHGDLNDHN
jgi:hypothetical protein